VQEPSVLSSSTPGPMVPSGSWTPTVNRYNPRFLSKEGTIRPQQIPDEDASMREALTNLVSSVSLPVERFASSTEFPRRGGSENPSCLVLDVRLPGRRRGRSDHRLHGGKGRRRLLQAGAVAVLYKPFDPEQLLRLVEDGPAGGIVAPAPTPEG
jgi:CheY-like chemotaxis protein